MSQIFLVDDSNFTRFSNYIMENKLILFYLKIVTNSALDYAWAELGSKIEVGEVILSTKVTLVRLTN